MLATRASLAAQGGSHHARLLVRALCVAVLLLGLLGCKPQAPVPESGARPAPRLVTVGGAVTETVFALGWGHAVVGTDTSSVYPEAAPRLPQVGYQRRLSAEGVIGLRPTAVLAADEAGPPAALAQIRAAGIAVHVFHSPLSVVAAAGRIREVAKILGAEARGEQLALALTGELAQAQTKTKTPGARPPRVLFIYARGAGTMMVAGRDTAVGEMLRLAGADNAAAALTGFKPLSSEAMVAAAPDVLLLTERGIGSLGGPEALFALPGVTLTPAGVHRRVVTMDDLLLLGFGPRLGQAVAQLQERLQSALPADESVAAAGIAQP